MKNYIKYYLPMKENRGAVAIIVGISLAMFLGFTALSVDIGYVMVTRNELQNIADTAALAAVRQISSIYEAMDSYDEQRAYVCDPATILPVAQDIALQNQAGGMNITVNAADVVIGRWNTEARTLTPTLNQPNAVQVTARRDGGGNGPVATFFAGVLGINTVNVSADATAALTGQGTAVPGGLPIPVAISSAWFQPGFCDQPIKFYPTGTIEGCAGWNTYDIWPANAARLGNILDQLRNGTYQSPEVIAGETQFVFSGGNIGSAFPEMVALFDAMKILNDGVIDADNDSNTWTTSVAVYDLSDCSNPTGRITISGFVTVIITGVTTSPANTIEARVLCEYTAPGRGGGGNFGTWGVIPGLVE